VKWFNILTAIFSAIATYLSVLYLLHLLPINKKLCFVIAMFFGLAFYLKEHAKMHTSNIDGNFTNILSYNMISKFKMIVCYSTALFCATGIESLFVVGIFLLVKHYFYQSPYQFYLIMSVSFLLASINFLTDYIFYLNCLKKYLRMPRKEINMQNKGYKWIIYFVSLSALSSSCFILYRSAFLFSGLFGNMISYTFIFGLLLGCFAFYANLCLLAQTFIESKVIKPEKIKIYNWLKLSDQRKSKVINIISCFAYAVVFVLPCIVIFKNAGFMQLLPKFITSIILVLMAYIITTSYFCLTENYLSRLFINIKK